MLKNSFRIVLSAVLFVSGLTAAAFAQTAETPKDFSSVRIKNFGEMDANFYRGAQPKKDDYASLATLGIKTVVDLRDDPENYEQSAAEAAGLKYVNIPMSDTEYPKPESIDAFLKLIGDPATGAIFVHCAGGRHRTGIIGAVYRFNKYGWNYEQVYAEMKRYDFYTRWGHGAMKDFVIDYAAKMTTVPVVVSEAQNTAGENR